MMMTRSPSQSLATINISASAPKLVVNNRISLLYYYRIADNILKQADIFREEGNTIDLYIMLLRFSSLATEAIPYHRDYRASPQSDKIYLKKRLLGALTELEDIKPAVQQTIENLQRKQVLQVNNYSHSLSKVFPTRAHDYSYSGQRIPQLSIGRPVEEQFRQISLNVPPPKEETLSRHSILGPNGLHGQWQPPTSDRRVLYPSNIDWSPVEIPSVRKPVDDGSLIQNDTNNLAHEIAKPESSEPWKKDGQISQIDEPISLISFEPIERPVQTEIIRQPSPPPVLADIHDLIPSTVPAGEAGSIAINSTGGVVCAEAPIELHIPTSIMDSFMRLAKSNTTKNLETCGVLAGALKNRKFCITALIIPKQESTSDSCQTTNEEEIFEVQDKQSLFPLGWIHTHPTQSCFMSSIDIHTHYSYQIMLPEAIAIVMAPTDTSKNHGIFRLTPGGLTVIRQCPKRGFHPHDPTDDGSPIYKQCTDVYVNPNLQFDVIDLR